ncbi:Large eukaryotic DNA virus major capsid protein [uncultured virus]|nr:Large eukaryotic DNA virus major capsid protein [uncultured virus]
MTSGLIQIITNGSQDLYLTGNPQITFFKIVYRRYTNFSIESKKIEFDNQTGFGKTSYVTLPKSGDLIQKTYLEIQLPEINLKKLQTNNLDLKKMLSDKENNYDLIKKFLAINRIAFITAFELFVAENAISRKMIERIEQVFSEVQNQVIINKVKNILNQQNSPYKLQQISLYDLTNSLPDSIDKNILMKYIDLGIERSVKIQKFYFEELQIIKNKYLESLDDNIKFAWVNKLGHALIDEIEILIGENTIDKHYGDWFNIWYELTSKKNMEENYFQLIGETPELTDFNRNSKPKYLLRIPLQFWYCRFNGLALPLVALQYHEVSFKLKLKKLEEVSYVELGELIKYENEGLPLSEITELMGFDLHASLLVDYIYLDSLERKKFAQASHEYLIDQLQFIEINDVAQKDIQINLNTFVHPMKELIWICQKQAYVTEENGYKKLFWDNYSSSYDYKGNPLKFSYLQFHGYDRVPKLESSYYNYLQPYENYYKTPADGINLYSFSLYPEEFQPSGSANMGILSKILLNLEFNEKSLNDVFNIRIYGRNLNILRFIGGYGGLIIV